MFVWAVGWSIKTGSTVLAKVTALSQPSRSICPLSVQEKMCEDSASFDLTAADLASAIREATDVAQKIQDLGDQDSSAGFDMTGAEAQGQGWFWSMDL